MIIKNLQLLAAVFLILALFANFNQRFPRIPGDIIIDKFGFTIYIPFVSAVVTAIILSALFFSLKISF